MATDITIIAAVAQNGVIGSNGEMPWHYSEDLKHFRAQTMDSPVIMGRVTYQSIVEMTGGPLDGRHNIVLSSSLDQPDEGQVTVVRSVDEALAVAAETESSEVFIAGGATVYEQAFPHATKMVLTRVPLTPDGDTYFPDWVEDQWEITERHEQEDLAFVTYERK